jgi:tRNA-dihydrouridine synthase B
MHSLDRRLKIGALELKNPLILAPMEGYSDQPFRRICRRLGADLVVTEFTSSEGLIRMAGRTESKISLAAEERPAAIQIFGRKPKLMAQAAARVSEENPDFIDINFGCPARKICGGGAGSQLMREPDLLIEIAREVVQATSLPVTAKLRLGWDLDSINILDVALRLEDLGIQALTLHARTRNQKYEGNADWEWIRRLKEQSSVPVIGNGDVRTPQDALRMFQETGVDAVMIGRAAMHNPWIFREVRAFLDHGEILAPATLEERVALLLDHLDLAVAHKGEMRAIFEMRKMYGSYLKGYRGVRELRSRLVRIDEVSLIREIILELQEQILSGELQPLDAPMEPTKPHSASPIDPTQEPE